MTVLLGGDPGIGKSTLVLQAAEAYSRVGSDVLYVTGEESPAQLKSRADRLGVTGERITVVNTTGLEEIMALLGETTYGVVIVDSIQTVATSVFDSPPGTVGQVRESAQQLINLSKATGFALLLVGHVTKEGMVAGPKVLEHMVDTVLYFDGDSQHLYRILRAVKNRFGSVAEIGLFEMGPLGLAEVANPSSLFLSGDLESDRTGSAVCAIVEGNRPIMVEVQALVSNANYGTPQRVAGGTDHKRLALLLAIIEKRCGMPMATNDVFVSVAGGLRLSEPAIDLALCIAIASSHTNRALAATTVVIGEVGLSGEVRRVALIDRRLKEAARLGFTRAVIPEANAGQLDSHGIELVPVKSVSEAFEQVIL